MFYRSDKPEVGVRRNPMDNTTQTTEKAKAVKQQIVEATLRVIKDPAGFYREMPKSGGFGDPLVFAVVMGVMFVRALIPVKS